MLKRILVTLSLVFATALCVATLVPAAIAQDAPEDITQDPGPKTGLIVTYPHDGVVLSGKGEDAVVYKGLIYVDIFPITARLKKKYGDGPVFREEIYPDGTVNKPTGGIVRLPRGRYEVHFSIREGEAVRTCIKNVILTANNDVNAEAEMSGTTQTLIIGGDDMTAQQMRDSILDLKKQVAALQAEIADLKARAK